jgi:membrane associated rhomboid family serine protease
MLPLSDVIPSKTTPYVTIGLIAVNILTFLYELQLTQPELQIVALGFGVVPAYFSWPTLITSQFLHDGWMHIFGNMLYLWIFGDNVEDRLGHGRYLVAYLVFGMVAALGQVALSAGSTIPMIGASGSIAGVMGAYFVLYPHSRVLTLIPWWFLQIVELPAIALLGFWFLMQLFSAGAIAVTANTHGGGGVAFAAHVVGFDAGVGGVFVFRKRALDPWDRVDTY